MVTHTLIFKPAIGVFGAHDPSAALFKDGELRFGVEEERYTREKHAIGNFPKNAIQACLDFENLSLSNLNKIVLPYDSKLLRKRFKSDVKRTIYRYDHPAKSAWGLVQQLQNHAESQLFPKTRVEDELRTIGEPLPPIEFRSHHLCHAASAFHPTEFEDALVVTIDGRGEYDSTVIWRGDENGLTRVKTCEYPNSLGHFFGAVTEYLGYHAFNGEGKIMGLAPYGERNQQIESNLRRAAEFGVEYDVTGLLPKGGLASPDRLEDVLGRPAKKDGEDFDQFHKDLAFTAQLLLEETVTDIVERYATEFQTSRVGLAGGVALNCKMNKQVMEIDCVDKLFIQPIAHDGGLALGGGWLESDPVDVQPMTNVYWGPETPDEEIETVLKNNKISYQKVDNVEQHTAERIADGKLIGWVQGRLEMGPRALGNRSILADPRTAESRDRVNEFVKHREEWRPFAPSMLEEAMDDYLVNAEPSPYMIKTFDTLPEKRDDIEAVLHPGDETTRPQTVREDQNPRYYRLISDFEDITGVPVILNTSFNDHGEPIVTNPTEAVRDFYGMGLDVLVIGDYVVEK